MHFLFSFFFFLYNTALCPYRMLDKYFSAKEQKQICSEGTIKNFNLATWLYCRKFSSLVTENFLQSQLKLLYSFLCLNFTPNLRGLLNFTSAVFYLHQCWLHIQIFKFTVFLEWTVNFRGQWILFLLLLMARILFSEQLSKIYGHLHIAGLNNTSDLHKILSPNISLQPSYTLRSHFHIPYEFFSMVCLCQIESCYGW